MSQNAVGAQHNSLDDSAVGQHGEADVHVGGDFQVVGAADGAFGNLLLNQSGNQVADVGLKTGLDDVAGHVTAHAAQSDKTNFHDVESPLFLLFFFAFRT